MSSKVGRKPPIFQARGTGFLPASGLSVRRLFGLLDDNRRRRLHDLRLDSFFDSDRRLCLDRSFDSERRYSYHGKLLWRRLLRGPLTDGGKPGGTE